MLEEIRKVVIDERELWNGERFWVLIDDATNEDVKEFYENEGADIETVRMWSKSNGYEKVEYTGA